MRNSAIRALRVFLCAAALGVTNVAQAQAAELTETVAFEIPAQSLENALLALSKQARLQLIISAALPEQATRPISGTMPIKDALDFLIRDTKLGYRLVGERTLAVRLKEDTRAEVPAEDEQIRLARAADQNPPLQSGEPAAKPQEEIETLDEVIVTGTHIRGATNIGAPLINITREEIDRSGYSTTQELLRSLPQNFGGGASEDPNGRDSRAPASAFGAGINLRGAGTDSTLVLINGRRLAPSGIGDFVDVSMIPLSAVQRVEVLTDGASALYGSDAIGGVVNFIMRTDYDGAGTGLRFGSASGGVADELQVSQLLGTSWDRGHALLSYEYHDHEPLRSADRDFTANSDLTRFGGSNFSRTTSNPGNILSPVDFVSLIAIPSGQDGVGLTPADFTPGLVNMQNTQLGTYSAPEREQHSVFATLSQSLGDKFSLFVDARYSRRKFENRSPASSFEFLFVPNTNAFFVDPFNDPSFGGVFVNYSFFNDFGAQRETGDAESYGGTLGTDVGLSGSWRAQIYGSYNVANGLDRLDHVYNLPNLSDSLDDDDIATAFNPFGDGSHSNPAVIAAIRGFTETTAASHCGCFMPKSTAAYSICLVGLRSWLSARSIARKLSRLTSSTFSFSRCRSPAPWWTPTATCLRVLRSCNCPG